MSKIPNIILSFLLSVTGLVFLFACDEGANRPEFNSNQTSENSIDFVEASTGLPTQGQWRHGITFYDMNGDGFIDILAPPPRKAAKEDRNPYIWFGNGKGEWTPTSPHVPMTIPYDYGDVAAGDFNGDGIPDMAFAIHGVGLKNLKGEGSGNYTDFSEGLPSSEAFSSRALVAADFNNDGISDVAAVAEGFFGRKNDGAKRGAMVCLGSQTKMDCRPMGDPKEMEGLFGDKIITGDVNGDGKVDVGIASLQHVRDLIVWLGDGKGGFSPFNNGLPTGIHYRSVAFADINGDGRDDLLACLTGFGKDGVMALKAFLSEKDGFRDVSQGLPDKEVYFAVSTGDLNGDGTKEIVGGTAEGGLKVFSQKGGKWRQVATPALPQTGLMRMYNTYCCDLNGDGYDDIIVNYADEKENAGAIRVFLTIPR